MPASALTFEAFGARIGIKVAAAIADTFQFALPPGARRAGGTRRDAVYSVRVLRSRMGTKRYELLLDGDRLGSSNTLDDVRVELESELHFQVALHARGFLFVHAGVVEWGGAAIVLPGPSQSGKSSLVMALVRRGARYRSDEYAVLDRDGLVHAYLKPLAERRAGMLPLLHQVSQLGPATEAAAIPLGRVVVARFRAGATWRPAPMSRAESMMTLFANTVVARTQARFALSVLSAAVATAEGINGERGEADDVAAHLLDMTGPPRT